VVAGPIRELPEAEQLDLAKVARLTGLSVEAALAELRKDGPGGRLQRAR
jgi:hypothetical protein